MIDKQSPIPIYYQIEEYLKKMIETGKFAVNQVIPSERELSGTFQVSRMTIRQAVSDLVNEGYLYRRKGKGTFVAEQKIEQPLQGLTSFTEDMIKRGMTPSTRVLHFDKKKASVSIAKQLGISEQELVYEIKRIRLADDIPMALEMSYIPVKLVPNLTETIVQDSFYKYIEDTLQLKIEDAVQALEASIVLPEDAKRLDMKPGAAVLLIHRHTYLTSGKALEWVKSVYRADRYKFLINMKRS
ncbi:phosphonate metabolism transcriptional regulator PhnF [Pullulanibacillus camelliae]|uniref:Phosphonate metabolism transcriptional regulator PhnF n=1 Tax=Pullulanibacillus camelliae TaxID=1707096 RepID=A0A8J2YLY2_9BACL|nr:GntR family transcriptional regulator [Pullulanibacillus camelliae]GGE52338.1 phosphonate metabolism transcriptional regulator PhnF [Pullulanibacillus camelliae]